VLSARTQALVAERAETLRLLREIARQRGETARYLHVRPRRELRTLLALPSGVRACVFELDGVLVASAELHVMAWEQTFDELVLYRRDALGQHVAPFHRPADYAQHVHGKPRLDGVRAFVESRGLTLPLGTPEDAPGAETLYGLANRKNDLLQHLIEARGVHAYDDSRHYVEMAVEADLRVAVVSASANTPRILERARLSDLVDACVDGRTMLAEHLRKRPAPDVLIAACRQLGIESSAVAAYETTASGVAAARAAAFGVVVAVDRSGHTGSLRGASPDIVTPDLGALLKRGIAA
jgi:beta-phosphoglucomutase-like phosphatase (HAD superfamily)